MNIPKHIIDEIKARVDIVGLVKEHVPLKKAGAVNYAACCPFHNEKTPSFTVSASKQFYHCFGCGAHGDQIAWMREYLGIPWSEAVARLAESAGIPLPENDESGWIKAKASASKTLDKAARWMHRQLMSNARAREYVLGERKVTPRAAEEFLIGLAPRVLQDYLAPFDKDEIQVLVQAGVLAVDERGRMYPKMGGRIVFPIRDAAGWVIGFSGRVMGAGQQPKYMNSPDSPFFVKRKELFRAPDVRRAARQAGRVVVTEGYFDVVSMFEADIGYAVAGMGTATTPENLESMFALASEVVFCFDGDKAGKQAAWKALLTALPVSGNNNLASFAFIPDGLDPDEFIKARGSDAFLRLLDDAQPLSKFFIDAYRAKKDSEPMERHSALIRQAASQLKNMGDTTLQNGLITTLASVFGMSVAEVRRAAGLPSLIRSVPASAAPSVRANAPETILLANLLRRPWEAGCLPDGVEMQTAGGTEIMASLKEAGVQEGDAGASARLFQNTPFWPLVERLMLSGELDDDIPTLARRIEEAWIKRTLKSMMEVPMDKQDRAAIRRLHARQSEIMRENDRCKTL